MGLLQSLFKMMCPPSMEPGKAIKRNYSAASFNLWVIIGIVATLIAAFLHYEPDLSNTCPTSPPNYTWLQDVKLEDGGSKWSFYSNPIPFVSVHEVCQSFFGHPIYIDSEEEERQLDAYVAANYWTIFRYTGPSLMWTGGLFNLSLKEPTLEWPVEREEPISYVNFCSKNVTQVVLEAKAKNWTGVLHVVKDYRGKALAGPTNATCWQVYHHKELIEMGFGPDPALFFACRSSANFFSPAGSNKFAEVYTIDAQDFYNNLIQQGIKDRIDPKDLPMATYHFYGFPAPYDVASRFCQNKSGSSTSGGELLFIESSSEEELLNHVLAMKYTALYSSRTKLLFPCIYDAWLSGYYDLGSNNPYQLRWDTARYKGNYTNFCPGVTDIRSIIDEELKKQTISDKDGECRRSRWLRVTKKYRPRPLSMTDEPFEDFKSCWQPLEMDRRLLPIKPTVVRHIICKKMKNKTGNDKIPFKKDDGLIDLYLTRNSSTNSRV